jgi:uncharacterized membrane protein
MTQRPGTGRAGRGSPGMTLGGRRRPAGPGRRFTRRRRRLRAGLAQLLFVVLGLAAGIFVPRITVPPLVSAGRIVELLFTAGVTVISLVTVIYSLLFLVVQWVSGTFSMRLALFRDDPIVWRAFAYSIGLFVFCFTAAFAIGNDKTVSVIVPVLALVLVVAALAFMRVLQTRAFVSMLLAPTLTAISERGRAILDGLYSPASGPERAPVALPPLRGTVTWPGRLAVLQQLHLGPLVAAAGQADAVVVLRQAVGVTLLTGMPVADVHGGRLGEDIVLRAIVTGPERSFDQDPELAFRLLADVGLRALSPAVNDPATAVQVIDALEDLLTVLAARTASARQVADEQGTVRVVLSLPPWEQLARGSVDDLIAAAASSPLVLLRLREMLQRLSVVAPGTSAPAVSARAGWVESMLARNFPVVWSAANGPGPAGGVDVQPAGKYPEKRGPAGAHSNTGQRN